MNGIFKYIYKIFKLAHLFAWLPLVDSKFNFLEWLVEYLVYVNLYFVICINLFNSCEFKFSEIVFSVDQHWIHKYCVHRSGDETGDSEGQYTDVVIEPYNSILTLLRLTCYADSVIVLDNLALHNLSPDKVFPRRPSFVNINKIVSNVMTASLAPIR